VDRNEGLAQRVLARIDTGTAERGTRTWSLAWLLAPAAAACVLAAAVFVFRQNRQPAPVPIVQTRPSVTSEAAAAAQTGTVRPVAATAPRVPAPAEGLRTAATVSSGSRGPVVARSASPSLEPLTLAPIVLDTVDVAPLVTAMPIEISTIAFERIELSQMP
jgi:hypothetical protein